MGAPMRAFENIGLAQVAKSAEQARDLGYLRPTDQISMNRDRLLADAKARVLKLAEDYSPPEPHTYHLPGPSGRLALEMALNDLALSGKATPHDVVVVGELAKVLTGGDDADVMVEIGEDELLALERAAIATLAKDVATLDRMEHMLAKGKPLRN
jgi:3-hydroxyacyl-CoA dehydrogenase